MLGDLGRLYLAGGPMMHPITLCSVVAVVVVLYKLIQFRSLQLDARDFFAQVRKELLNGRVREAAELCEARRGPAGSVLHAGVLKIGAPRDEVVSAMESTALYELAQLEGKLGLLDVDYRSAEVARWSEIACELLGLRPDRVAVRGHVNTMICWSRRHVLSMIDRIQSRSDIDWRYRLYRIPTFSECILYGVYVREVLGYDRSAHAPSHRPLVRGSWGLDLRDPVAMAALFSDLAPETVAVMVHSKDGVEPAAYRHHAERYWASYSTVP